MSYTALLGVWGALTILALISAAISIVLHFRGGSFHELRTEVRQLSTDVENLYDSVERWTHRQRVRNMRDGVAAQSLTPQRGSSDYKAHLRAKAAGKVQ